MKLFKIVKDNNKELRKPSKKVENVKDSKYKELLLDMIEYLKLSQDDKWSEENKVRPGVGLAAPQIGINEMFLAIYYKDENDKIHQYGFINPKIISESVKKVCLQSGEGCLSVDKEHPGYVYRSNKITFKAYNILTEQEETHTFYGLEAIIFQHEYDHLKGVLFYDRINKENPFNRIENSVII